MSTKCWKAWNNRPKLKELSRGSRTHHFKTSYMLCIAESMDFYDVQMRDLIRERKLTPKKFKRLHFFTFTMKQQTVDLFLSDLVRYCGEVRPIMYYGNGVFSPGMKGLRSVPCKWVKERCKNYFECYSVNEFRTSQVCPTCNERLLNVRKQLRRGCARRTLMVRGLKYCNSTICRSHPYKNRDLVGCANIYRKMRIEYPDILDHSGERWDDPADLHNYKPKYWRRENVR